MARLIALLLVVVLAVPARAGTVTSSTAETYRRAAELCKGIALEERARRQAAEHDAREALELKEHWKDAAKVKPDSKTPDWIWPSAALVAIAAFAAGFLIAHQDRRE